MYYYFDDDSLSICQTPLVWVKLPVWLAASSSVQHRLSLLLLPPVKQQHDSSDTEQLPPESLLSWACGSLPSATPCTMSHLPFMALRAFKSLQSSSGGMQRGNSKPPTSKLLLQFWGVFLPSWRTKIDQNGCFPIAPPDYSQSLFVVVNVS